MNNFTSEIVAVGNMLGKQVKAQDKTNDARRILALALNDKALNLHNAETAAELKLDIMRAYPRGTGKDADEDQKKSVSAVRQVISTYKKSCDDNLSPNNYDTYAEWRKAVYNEKPPTKLETITKWLEANEPEITLQDLQMLIDSYKAVELKAA